MYIQKTFSNLLILISLIFTILALLYPAIYVFGINNEFLKQWLYHIYIIQFFTWTFLHGGIFHFLANSVFIYVFWNMVEWFLWKKKMIIFFIFVVFFNWLLLSYFSSWNTVWISWFCIALIAYYTLELKNKNNPEYKWWITALIISVWIWFIPWISLLGHLFWWIAGIIFYYINKEYLKKQFIWVVDIEKS